MKLPWPVTCGVRTAACVVIVQSRSRVGCETNIEAGRVICILQDVDDVLITGHGSTRSRRCAVSDTACTELNSSRGAFWLAILATSASLSIAISEHARSHHAIASRFRRGQIQGLPSRSSFGD